MLTSGKIVRDKNLTLSLHWKAYLLSSKLVLLPYAVKLLKTSSLHRHPPQRYNYSTFLFPQTNDSRPYFSSLTDW